MRALRLIPAALVAALLALASPAGAVVVHVHGKTFGVTPLPGVSPSSVPGAAVKPRSVRVFDNGALDYHSGPVLHSSTPYLIFWDPNGQISSTTKTVLENYFRDVAADSGKPTNVYAVSSQYTDGSGNASYAQTWLADNSQAIADSHNFPTVDTANCDTASNCITDSQIKTELRSLISSDKLPTGLNPIYFVVTPPNENVCIDDNHRCTDSSGAGGFCAYHGNFPLAVNNGPTVLYAAIPLFFSGAPNSLQDPKACQYDGNSEVQEPNNDIADVALKYVSHEQNETITDPVNGLGWWDDSSGQENGDECNFYGSPADPANGYSPDAFQPVLGGSVSTGSTDGAGNPLGSLYDQVISGDHYYIQSEWSNANLSCEMRPTPTATFSSSPVTPLAHEPVSFDATNSSDPNSGATLTYQWDFGDGTSGSGMKLTHSYAGPGVYTVKLTVTDNMGVSDSSAQTITVNTDPNPVPALTVNTAHPEAGLPVAFDGSKSSDSVAPIVSYSWSFGDGAAAATQAVTHTYSRKGTYTVTLTVVDGFGDQASTTQTVKVRAPQISISLKRNVLRVKVDQGGLIKLGSKQHRLKRAGTAKFKLVLSHAQANRLRSGHAVKLMLKIHFKPLLGASVTKSVTLTIRP